MIQRARRGCFSRTERPQRGYGRSSRVQGLVVFSLWLAAMVARAGEGAPPVSPNERVHLFNGKDVGGFYTWLVDTKREDPRHVFAVTNGMIRISGQGLGYLATEKRYRSWRVA